LSLNPPFSPRPKREDLSLLFFFLVGLTFPLAPSCFLLMRAGPSLLRPRFLLRCTYVSHPNVVCFFRGCFQNSQAFSNLSTGRGGRLSLCSPLRVKQNPDVAPNQTPRAQFFSPESLFIAPFRRNISPRDEAYPFAPLETPQFPPSLFAHEKPVRPFFFFPYSPRLRFPRLQG